MALMGFMAISGQDQGNIEGGATQTDHEGEIELLRFEHQVEVPGVDSLSTSAGAPVHGAIHLNLALGGSEIAADQLEQRRLSGAVAPDDAYPVTTRDFERDIAECSELARRGSRPESEALEAEHIDQLVALAAVQPVDLRYAVEPDGKRVRHSRKTRVWPAGRP